MNPHLAMNVKTVQWGAMPLSMLLHVYSVLTEDLPLYLALCQKMSVKVVASGSMHRPMGHRAWIVHRASTVPLYLALGQKMSVRIVASGGMHRPKGLQRAWSVHWGTSAIDRLGLLCRV